MNDKKQYQLNLDKITSSVKKLDLEGCSSFLHCKIESTTLNAGSN